MRILAETDDKIDEGVAPETGTQEVGNKKMKFSRDREAILDAYKEIFFKDGEEITFCRVEKCKIDTEKVHKIVKKGDIVPQALRREPDKYIRDLEERKINRRPEISWRNPIRAIEKPNGGVRLVSNFMTPNGLCEKNPYELNNMRDVIRFR